MGPPHVPTVGPHTSVPRETPEGRSFSNPCRPSVVQPDLVSQDTEMPSRPTSTPSTIVRHCHQPRGPTPPTGCTGQVSSGRLACIRRAYEADNLSEGVISVLRKSWRESTESTYSAAWRQWDRWCVERTIDPLPAPLNCILEFLYEQFQAGKQYRTINAIRSAISMTHTELDGCRVGQHPLVCCFLKGVFNSRPPMPRYSLTWDVDVVLSFLETQPDLSLQLLTQKLAMLMALANTDRCSDLAALDLSFRSFQHGGVKFAIPGLTKTRKDGPPIEAFYSEFPENQKLCPIRTLKCYEKRSKNVRQSEGSRNPLVLATCRPHRPVKACTIGNWLKVIMSRAGIDTQHFTAHSTKGAATSKAKSSGVSTSDILRAANWSSSSTFTRFYHRPVQTSQFGRRVLTWHHLVS